MKMSMQHKWIDTRKGKPKCSEKTLSQGHFVHHNSHIDWPGIESGSQR